MCVKLKIVITPTQIRAARALASLTQVELAQGASVGIATVRRIEGSTVLSANVQTIQKLQEALEDRGILFIEEDHTNGPGVRLRDRTTKMRFE